jgi:hypothetical protein
VSPVAAPALIHGRQEVQAIDILMKVNEKMNNENEE